MNNQKPNVCCNDENNLIIIEKTKINTPFLADKIVQQCNKCNAKHHELVVEKGVFNYRAPQK